MPCGITIFVQLLGRSLYNVEWHVFLLVAAETSESLLHDKQCSSTNESAILPKEEEDEGWDALNLMMLFF
jgi:hypothetical protein